MTEPCQFTRVILGLHHNLPQHGLRLAAEVAALLRAELCGLLVKEDELAGLASFPFAREFRPLEGGWHTLDRLAHDLDLAAERARQSFAEAARASGLPSRLEVSQGSMAQAIASISQAGDIIIVTEPVSAAERVTLQFQSMVNAALGSAAAVMVVPPRIIRRRGAVVAIAASPHDDSIRIAATLAALANEESVVVEAFEPGVRSHPGGPAAVASRRVRLPPRQVQEAAALIAALQPLQERLVVVTRGVLDDAAIASFASTRRIPVLVVEPSVSSPPAERTAS